MSFVPKLAPHHRQRLPLAIYSLNHKPIGKSTQERPYTTGAHVNYITRNNALGRLDGARMPVERDGARDFFNDAEDGSRSNGRVADKLMLALPKELNPEQRAELVRGYAEDVTDGRAPWLAAHHDKGKDAQNPHCHLVFRDRDPNTGKRVFGTTDRGSTQRLRDKWQAHANRALERAGRPERIDARSLKAQGIDREPQVHEGPRNRAAAANGRRPVSRPRDVRNGPGARSPSRRVNYPALDRGRTRPEYNRARPTERDHWNDLDAHRQREELDGLRRLHLPPDGRREEPQRMPFKDRLNRRVPAPSSEKTPGEVPKSFLDRRKPPPLPQSEPPQKGLPFRETPPKPKAERPPRDRIPNRHKSKWRDDDRER
jgi:hypothetical protein